MLDPSLEGTACNYVNLLVNLHIDFVILLELCYLFFSSKSRRCLVPFLYQAHLPSAKRNAMVSLLGDSIEEFHNGSLPHLFPYSSVSTMLCFQMKLQFTHSAEPTFSVPECAGNWYLPVVQVHPPISLLQGSLQPRSDHGHMHREVRPAYLSFFTLTI